MADTSSNPFAALQNILSLLSKARLAYRAYNYINPSTQTGYGSGLPQAPTTPDTSFPVEGTPNVAPDVTGAVPDATAMLAPDAMEAAPDATAMLMPTGEAAGEGVGAGAAEGIGSGVGVGTIGMLAAPIIMSMLAYGAGSGQNEPLQRRAGTVSDINTFTNDLKNYTGQDISSVPDLSKLYQSMINTSRQGNVGANQNSGFTREQINNMLMQQNPGITGQQLQQLGNPTGYDAISQAYKTYLGS